MNPAKPPPISRPTAPAALGPAPLPIAQAAAGASHTPIPARMPLAMAGLVIGLAAVLLASACAYAWDWLLGASSPWAAALGAALGVVMAALPLGWLVLRVARDSEPGTGRAGTGQELALGVAKPMFMELAEREWGRARRYGTGAALLLVDVDRFLRLCEAHGLAAGDAVLNELLQQTAPSLRTADVLTRFGDAQMAVFLAHADATGALDVAERIRERAEQLEVPFSPQRLRVTVSVGVAHLRPAHLNLQALVDDVEEALAAARQAGGNCVRAAPVQAGRSRSPGSWRDDHRARPK